MHPNALRSVAVVLLCLSFNSAGLGSAKKNLEICLSGKYPALCDRSKLSAEQLRQAKDAERRQNVRVCMQGKYVALCDHSKLTPEEAAAVRQAERKENFRVCIAGRYPALCKHALLAPEELKSVRAAEAAENLKVCLDGRFPALCKRELLNEAQIASVAEAEKKTAPARRQLEKRLAERRAIGDCDAHTIEQVEADGKIIKLGDGSLWEVEDIDVVTTALWLPLSKAIVCRGRMTNVDDDETVDVTPIDTDTSNAGGASPPRPAYVVQAVADDETFVINDEVFKAKTYCFNFEKGDKVIFISGSPFGACASAQLLNLRTDRVCEVWCE